MKKLKLAYFGTPDFSAYFLEKLLTDRDIPIEVVHVVTQEDKPVGRKQIITASPVKKVAGKYNIPVETGPTLSLPPASARQSLRAVGTPSSSVTPFDDIDLALLYAYGEFISKEILEIPKYGFWNIHPSLLPKYRGSSPVATALIDGETETGVSLIQLDEELDHGPIIAQKGVKIEPKERTPELSLRLADEGYELFKETVHGFMGSWVHGLKTTSQDDSQATFTKRFEKQDGFVAIENFKLKIENFPEELFNQFRGLYPWPGIWSIVRIKNKELRIKITDMDLVTDKLIIKKVQLEGKKEVDFTTFNREYQIF